MKTFVKYGKGMGDPDFPSKNFKGSRKTTSFFIRKGIFFWSPYFEDYTYKSTK
jgi:hypothetical protein